MTTKATLHQIIEKLPGVASYGAAWEPRVFPGSATLQRGFWSRAGARRSQARLLAQDIRNEHLAA